MKTKFSGRRPVMFYQEAEGSDKSFEFCPRVRIFYPDGKSEWCALATFGQLGDRYTSSYEFVNPCWNIVKVLELHGDEISVPPSKTMGQAIRRARRFDRIHGFPKMEFLGEL
jgi:hypothetical protein